MKEINEDIVYDLIKYVRKGNPDAGISPVNYSDSVEDIEKKTQGAINALRVREDGRKTGEGQPVATPGLSVGMQKTLYSANKDRILQKLTIDKGVRLDRLIDGILKGIKVSNLKRADEDKTKGLKNKNYRHFFGIEDVNVNNFQLLYESAAKYALFCNIETPIKLKRKEGNKEVKTETITIPSKSFILVLKRDTSPYQEKKKKNDNKAPKINTSLIGNALEDLFAKKYYSKQNYGVTDATIDVKTNTIGISLKSTVDKNGDYKPSAADPKRNMALDGKKYENLTYTYSIHKADLIDDKGGVNGSVYVIIYSFNNHENKIFAVDENAKSDEKEPDFSLNNANALIQGLKSLPLREKSFKLKRYIELLEKAKNAVENNKNDPQTLKKLKQKIAEVKRLTTKVNYNQENRTQLSRGIRDAKHSASDLREHKTGQELESYVLRGVFLNDFIKELKGQNWFKKGKIKKAAVGDCHSKIKQIFTHISENNVMNQKEAIIKKLVDFASLRKKLSQNDKTDKEVKEKINSFVTEFVDRKIGYGLRDISEKDQNFSGDSSFVKGKPRTQVIRVGSVDEQPNKVDSTEEANKKNPSVKTSYFNY